MTALADAPDRLRAILREAHSIAVVGASPDPWRASFGISRYLKSAGYRMVPVNPNHAGATLHGETIVAGLDEAGAIDLVNVFRRSDHVGEAASGAIRIAARAIWMQLGVVNASEAARAEAAGLQVVMNRCISVENGRLLR